MARITKSKIQDALTLLTLAIFPLGQLPGVLMQNILATGFRIHLLDVLALSLLISYLDRNSLVKLKKMLLPTVAVLVFSSLLSLATGFFGFEGMMYLVRLLVYLSLFVVFPKRNLATPLLLTSIVLACFGWLQYFVFADLTALKYFGWDDHYFRMVSTFLDPAFFGVLMVLFTLLSIERFIKTRSAVFVATSLFLLTTLAFTYSRASFLAFALGVIILLWRRQKLLILGFIAFLVLIVNLLPVSPGGEGVNLARTNSIYQKIDNYRESAQIIGLSPVFGVGFNNVCTAKNERGFVSGVNSCHGLDNSVLFTLATTGVVGLAIISLFIAKTMKSAILASSRGLITSSMSAVLLHSMFSNTAYYPWVLFYLVILLSSEEFIERK